MKAPTYILKRVYLERNNDREYQSHQGRLKSIKSSINLKSIGKETDKIKQCQERYHEQSGRQVLKDIERKQQYQNRVLIGKITEIKERNLHFIKNQLTDESEILKSRSSFGRLSYTPIAKSNRFIFQQSQLEDLNIKLFEKIKNLPPVIPKAQNLEIQYEETQKLASRIRKVKDDSIKKLYSFDQYYTKLNKIKKKSTGKEINSQNNQIIYNNKDD